MRVRCLLASDPRPRVSQLSEMVRPILHGAFAVTQLTPIDRARAILLQLMSQSVPVRLFQSGILSVTAE